MRPRLDSPTRWVLAALIAGSAIGLLVAYSGDARLLAAAVSIEPIGVIWVNAIRMTVIPLVVSLLVTGVADRSSVGVGRLGRRSLLAFAGLLAFASVYALITVPWSMHWLHIDPAASAALRAGVTANASETSAAIHAAPGFREWLVSLVPANPVRAAADGAFLPLIVFTLCFALAVSRLEPSLSVPLLACFRAIADAMMLLVRGIIRLAPIGVFALIVPATARLGLSAAGALGYYTVVTLVLASGLMLLLYPLVSWLSGVSPRQFARASLPAQTVALASSSSLAALPALIEGADRVLMLPPAARGFVIPLAASTFKIGSPVAKVTGALFLANLYGVHVGTPQLLTLVLASVLLSVSTPGVPHGWLIVLAPLLVSIGLPPEGVGLLMAVDVIPDMIYTVLNVTGYLAAAAIAGRPEGLTVGGSDSLTVGIPAGLTVGGSDGLTV